MEPTRATWTDERLDDLARRVEDGFARVDADLRSLRTELGARIDALEARVDSRLDGLEVRVEALQRTILQVGGGMIATFLVGFAGLIATQL